MIITNYGIFIRFDINEMFEEFYYFIAPFAIAVFLLHFIRNNERHTFEINRLPTQNEILS